MQTPGAAIPFLYYKLPLTEKVIHSNQCLWKWELKEIILIKHFKNLKVPYKTCDVHVHKSCHQILTIKSVHYPAMSRNGVCKILQKQTNIWANFQKITCYKTSTCKCLLAPGAWRKIPLDFLTKGRLLEHVSQVRTTSFKYVRTIKWLANWLKAVK